MIFDWQPGHTAPRDGSTFLARHNGLLYFTQWTPHGPGDDELPGEWCRCKVPVEWKTRMRRRGEKRFVRYPVDPA